MIKVEKYIEDWFYNSTVLTKSIGNTGYYVRYGNFGNYQYVFITKEYLIYIISHYETNTRKIKLISLEILNDE
jgi:hypothetical protein